LEPHHRADGSGTRCGSSFIAAVDVIAPELVIVRTVAPLYLVFLGAYSITWVLEGAFNAIRKSEYYFILNLLYGSRILFLFPLVFLGAMGIFSSFGLSFVLGLILASFSSHGAPYARRSV